MNDFQEYFDKLMVPGEYRKHYRNTQDWYAARYADRQQKNNAAAILAFSAINSHVSTRQIEKRVELVSDLY